MDPEIIAAFIGPVFTAMLAGAGIAIKSIQVRRRDQHSRSRDIEVAGQTVSFIDAYLSAHEKLSPESPQQQFIRERAIRDLEAAYQTMMVSASADHEATTTTGAWLEVIKRALLIPVHRMAAKVVRVFFYISLFYGLVSSALYVSFALTDPDLMRDIPLMVATLILLFVFAFLPMILLYLWARWLDRDRTPKPQPAAAPAAWPQPGGYGSWQPVPGPPTQQNPAGLNQPR